MSQGLGLTDPTRRIIPGEEDFTFKVMPQVKRFPKKE